MADYTTLTETATDPDAPVTSGLIKALRDNPIAIAEGASGAPRIQMAAFGRLADGAVSKHDRTYVLTTNGEYARYPFVQFGTVTYAYSSTGLGTTTVTRYRSGATTTISPGNVSVQPGDVLVFVASGLSGSFSPRVRFTTSGGDIFPISEDWAGYTSVNAAP